MTIPALVLLTVAFGGVLRVGALFYALYKKGDVHAVISHGRTVFELNAKERTRTPKAGL
jgi:hypothetical protein